MGQVWSAVREGDGHPVALKVLKVSGVDPVRRLVREARIAQRLQHPNVVAVEEILAPPSGSPIIVLELLDGQSLRDRLNLGPMTISEAAHTIGAAVAAVGSAHSLGIVHRDLKPENLYLHRGRGGTTITKVLDFGIAKVVTAEELHTAGMTNTGTMLGTPAYMAPEQIFGERDVDGRADVWALGVILYECVSGSRPFEGENAGQIFKAITMGKATPLVSRCPDLPPSVLGLVDRMLASERTARPSLVEILSVLEGHADGPLPKITAATPLPASIDPLAQTLDVQDFWTPPPLHVSVGRGGSAPVKRRVPVWIVAAGALVVLAIGGGLVRARAHTAAPVPALEASAVVKTEATTPAPAQSASAPPVVAEPAEPVAIVDAGAAPPSAPSKRPATRSSSVSAGGAAHPGTPSSAPARLPGGVHAVSPY
ncbi:serine/threonine protein kinase [Labilithrix luteola]|uniref:Serine/threonine protein kinase n=2 Tax=Labilithrix luteola TaxID=1391654 RepID=A0A0K1PML6_9BACT|nr:serine/threonine protein kinase [Labilithrix luteola]